MTGRKCSKRGPTGTSVDLVSPYENWLLDMLTPDRVRVFIGRCLPPDGLIETLDRPFAIVGGGSATLALMTSADRKLARRVREWKRLDSMSNSSMLLCQWKAHVASRDVYYCYDVPAGVMRMLILDPGEELVDCTQEIAEDMKALRRAFAKALAVVFGVAAMAVAVPASAVVWYTAQRDAADRRRAMLEKYDSLIAAREGGELL